MGQHRFSSAKLRPARFAPADLEDYLTSEFVTAAAAHKASSRREKRASVDAYQRRLNRMAVTLQYKSLHHLMVWYALEYKGWQSARAWQSRLAELFGANVMIRHERAFEHLEQLLGMIEREGSFCVATYTEGLECNTDTVIRHMRELANYVGVEYSARWMVFLYALHKEILARPELTQIPTAEATATKAA